MERVRKRLYPTEPIMKRRFGKLSDEGKHCINFVAEQFKAGAHCLRDLEPEELFEGMTVLIGTLLPHVTEVMKHHNASSNDPLLLFTEDALSLWQIYNGSAPLLEDLYSGLTAEPAWGMPVNLDREDLRAQPLIALHEFIEELIVVVKKLIVPVTQVQLNEGVM